MAMSSRTTDAMTAAEVGTGSSLKSPQPRLSPADAKLMAVAGSRILKSAVFSATMARLLGQRLSLEYDLGRRGIAASHNASAVKTAREAPSRTAASLGSTVDLRRRRVGSYAALAGTG